MVTNTLTLDDLDLTRCVIGPDSVLEVGSPSKLYVCRAGEVHLIGTFTRAAEALAALDDADLAA